MGICASSSPLQDLELPTAASSVSTSTTGLTDEPKTPTKSKQDAFAATKAPPSEPSEASPADVDLKVETSPAAAGGKALAARSEKLSPQAQKRKEEHKSSEAQVKKLLEAKKRLPFIFNRSFRDTDVKKDEEEEEKDVGGLATGPAKWSGSFMKVRRSIQPKGKSGGSVIGSEGFGDDGDLEASFFSAALSEMGTYGGLFVQTVVPTRRSQNRARNTPRWGVCHGSVSTALHTTPRRSRLFNPSRATSTRPPSMWFTVLLSTVWPASPRLVSRVAATRCWLPGLPSRLIY